MSVTLSDCRVTNVSVGVVRLERYDNYSSDIYLKAADTLSIGLTPSLPPSLEPSPPRLPFTLTYTGWMDLWRQT